MDQNNTRSPRPRLRLHWIAIDPGDDRGHSWHAYDGPWMVGHVHDEVRVLVSDIPRYYWRMTRLIAAGVMPSDRNASRRAAAAELEAAYFAALAAPDHISGGLDEALAYAEWKGLPLTPDLIWSKSRQEGRNPFPIRLHRAQLHAWAIEDRKRGGRGMLTPTIMANAFGPDWMERIHG